MTAVARKSYLFEDLAVGMEAALSRTVSEADITAFAEVTGDRNPVHVDAEYAAATLFKGRIAHGMLSAGYISAVFGMELPGPGAIYVSQTLNFKAPVYRCDRFCPWEPEIIWACRKKLDILERHFCFSLWAVNTIISSSKYRKNHRGAEQANSRSLTEI